MSMIELPYQWLSSNAELASAAQQWSQADIIALDTEFVRTETFYARLGLVQVGVADQVWLVDPLRIDDWAPLNQILADQQVIKVLHSLSEDAEVLQHQLQARLVNVFDTQIAAGFLGRPVQVSYAKLVEELFAVTLGKEETRSDWTQRPLTQTQCHYAAADVYWLYRVYQQLAAELAELQRAAWVFEDTDRVIGNSQLGSIDRCYLKLRGGWKLKSERLLALKNLAVWRERLARSEDLNRGRILPDKDLISIAERMPANRSALQKQLKLPSRKIRLYGDAILQQVQLAVSSPRSDWPERIPGPLPADQAGLLKRVRAALSELADELAVPVELLARRKLVEEWLRSGVNDGQYQLPEAFTGWRQSFLLENIQPILDQHRESAHEA